LRKKVVNFCNREAISAKLPCVKSKKRYERKVVEFEKPLFPGYVFFQDTPDRALSVLRSDYTANVLAVFDQLQFERQLTDILTALESGYGVLGARDLRPDQEVRIKAGPLAGMIGKIARIAEQTAVILRFDFLTQGAAVVVDSNDLEVLD